MQKSLEYGQGFVRNLGQFSAAIGSPHLHVANHESKVPSLRAVLLFVYALAAALITGQVYDLALRSELDGLAATGEIRVDQASERLTSQLDRFQVLSNVLARDPRIKSALRAGEDATAIEPFLRDQVLAYGAAKVELIDRSGTVVASSDGIAGQISRAGAPLLTAALNGRLGLEHGLEANKRLFRFSRGVALGLPPANGALIISAEIAALEFDWAFAPEAVAFFDAAGIVYVANRAELLLREASDRGSSRFQPFPGREVERLGPHRIWQMEPGLDLPNEALVVRLPVPRIAMTARGFLDIAPARSVARLAAMLAAALMALIGLAGLTLMILRRRMSDRLAFEAAANARLETEVESRTKELHETQHQLVQASKMSALGEMSAGISHELNQPLAAILNYASNGMQLIELDRSLDAKDNLDQITGQVHRIDRIIRNLRGFARNEEEALGPVDLVACCEDAMGLVETALSEAGVSLTKTLTPLPVTVMGGHVRLQQVLVNLLTNAIDAMAGSTKRHIDLTIQTDAGKAIVAIRDSGPGIADPSRVFEPFYSTKELGASKGLGLGLSISYGIIGSFGGDLTADNRPNGGACFTISLPLAPAEAQ